jgi:predicted Zn-dependent peptidase
MGAGRPPSAVRLPRRSAGVGLLLLLAGAAAGGVAAPPGARDAAADPIPIEVREHTLPNGLQILLVPRRGSPTVATYLRFKVGSVQEHNGITGIAHFLEHLMFQGTRRIGTRDHAAEAPLMATLERLQGALAAERAKGAAAEAGRVEALRAELAAARQAHRRTLIPNEISELYRRHGGVGLNASTSRDGTQYTVQLPANKLELWAFLESDRMADPVFRGFEAERDVVHEERRLRYETSPAGTLYETLYATAYLAHPYRHPVIGWPSDVDRLRPDQVAAFFRTYYAPNNAVAALVGDLDPEAALALLARYFGPIPAGPIPRPTITAEPEQRGERRVTVEFDAQPQLLMGYRIPGLGHPDTDALRVLGWLLASGRTSRFHRALVEGRGLALSVSAGAQVLQREGLFTIYGVPRAPHAAGALEAGIEDALARLAAEPPTERELTRVRNQVDVAMARTLASNAGLAAQLGNAQALAGTWRGWFESRGRMRAVTAEDVQRVARQYLTAARRTVVTLAPAGRTAGRQEAGGPSPSGTGADEE